MAVRKKSTGQILTPRPPSELLISRSDTKSKLQERIQKGLEIKQLQIGSSETFEIAENEYNEWDAFNTELLKRIFTTVELANEYSYWVGSMILHMREKSLGEKIAQLYKEIDQKNHRMDSIIERLELVPLNYELNPSLTKQDEPTFTSLKTKKVFLVHGHDEIAKTNLEVFYMKLD